MSFTSDCCCYNSPLIVLCCGQDCSAGPNGTPLCGCRAGIDAGCQVHSDDDFGPYSLGTLASAEYRETVASDGSTMLSAFYRDGAESATDPEWGARSMQVSTGSLFTFKS
eukprot:COSAG04_NODE_1211_length_7719_cov_2.630232_4_plen_110_part_00